METAKNSASYYTKTAQECSFAVQNSTISKISQASTLIDRCLSGMDDCSSCKGYFCESIYHLPASDIDFKNTTMANPFYEREEAGNCLMLNVM